MALSSLTITITNPRVIDGFVATLNSENEGSANPRTLEEFVLQQVNASGRSMANSKKIGIIPSSAFILRFTGAELSAIKAAAAQSPELAALLADVGANAEAYMDDPRLLPGLQLLTAANLLDPERIAELLTYDRPEVVEP